MALIHKSAKEGELLPIKNEIEELLSNGASDADIADVLGNTDAYRLTALHYAVKYQNTDILRFLLKNGADVNKRGDNGTTCLHFAARYFEQEDTKTGEEIIDLLLTASNVNINCADDDGATPLHYACLKNNHKAVRKLLAMKNISIEAKDKWQTTPLQAACSIGSISIVKRLLKKGARIDVHDEAYNSPLHVACSGGHQEVVIEMFDQTERQFGFSALSNMLIEQNREGQSPLHVAVLASHFHVIKVLLESGADARQLMLESETPLHIAAVTGHLAISRLLIAHDALIDAKNDDGRTPLHKAAVFGKSSVVELLLEKSADVNIQGRFKVTALMLAASSNYPDIVSILLQHNANICAKDYEGKTALHLAASGNAVLALQVLLSNDRIGKILNQEDKDGNTALHISCIKGFDDVTKLLLDAGVIVSPRNNLEQTPAHLASLHGRADVVSALLNRDASTINDIDKKGNAALHIAASNGHVETMKVLLHAGASINDRNTKLLTPLDCAACNGEVEAAKVLLDRKASVDPMYKYGMTPLLYASQNGHGKMVELLLQTCDISLIDQSGRNCLDLAIDHDKKQSAMAILRHRDWRTAMRNKTIEDDIITTPMRKLIKKMPDVCILALNNCVSRNENVAPDHDDYHLKLEYEFLDDVYSNWPCDAVRFDSDEGKGRGTLLTKYQINKQLKKKNNHALWIMVSSKREEILSHPLVVNLLSWKWNAYGGYLNEHCQLMEDDLPDGLHKKFFIEFGRVVIVGLAIIHLVFEFFQAIAQGIEYFSLDNALEVFVYLLAIVNVADDELKFSTKMSSLGAFKTPLRSMVKTLVMMSGELDFSSVFDSTFVPPPAAWPMFLMFVVLLTIILMNLLVGLAVDDIQEVQKQAVLNRMKMQIDLALDAEKSLPGRFRKWFVAKDQTIHPNRKNILGKLSYNAGLVKSLEQTFKSKKSAIDELKDHAKELEIKNIELEKKLIDISNHMEKLDRIDNKLMELMEETKKSK
eukprot:gene302-929_t